MTTTSHAPDTHCNDIRRVLCWTWGGDIGKLPRLRVYRSHVSCDRLSDSTATVLCPAHGVVPSPRCGRHSRRRRHPRILSCPACGSAAIDSAA